MAREVLEETGLSVTVERLLLELPYEYPDRVLDLSFWLCSPTAGSPEQHDGRARDPFRWIALSELERLHFPPANEPILRILLRQPTSS